MKVKKIIPYLLPLALTASLSAHAGTDYIDTFHLIAFDSGSGVGGLFLEGLAGTITYDFNTGDLSNTSFTQIDNANGGMTFIFDLSNNNASQITFIPTLDGFSVNANFDTAGDVNPGFGTLTIAVNGPLTVGTPYALQSGSIYDFNGNSYNLVGGLTLTSQQIISAANVPVLSASVPEPEVLALMLLGLPLLGLRRKQAPTGNAMISA